MSAAFVQNVRQLLTDDVRKQLQTEGYAVLDGGAPTDVAEAFLNEIAHAEQQGLLKPNKVQFLLKDGATEVTKPNVFEGDMHDAALREKLPTFADLFAHVGAFIEMFNETCPWLQLNNPSDTPQREITIKAQVNRGGCFPWHYDNPSPPNKRMLTMALYLCPDWQPAAGGELVVMPFLKPQVVVPPRFNRLVLFSSDRMLHRVLPACPSSVRRCFTVWFDSDATNPDDDVNLRAKHLVEDSIPRLMTTPLQRSLSRAVYDEEYRRSLAECFGRATRDGKLSMMIHNAHVAPLLGRDDTKEFVALLRKRRPAGDCEDDRARSVAR